MIAKRTLSFSPVAAHPQTAAVHAAVRARDWPAVRAAVGAATGAARTELVRAGAEAPRSGRFLRTVVDRNPEDPLAATMLAYRLIVVGWGVRGAARARYVSREQFDIFHSYLRQAEHLLIRVCADDPEFESAWCARLVTARGLELGEAETRRRYDQIERRYPHHPDAQSQMLQRLCPKWGGSMDKMHAFARACTEAAPAGAYAHAIVVVAHLEHWLEAGQTAESYFLGPQARNEIRSAGNRSVLHPAFQPGIGSVRALSTFALGYSLIGDWAGAKQCFTALGRYADRDGWTYFAEDPTWVFKRYRAKARRLG